MHDHPHREWVCHPSHIVYTWGVSFVSGVDDPSDRILLPWHQRSPNRASVPYNRLRKRYKWGRPGVGRPTPEIYRNQSRSAISVVPFGYRNPRLQIGPPAPTRHYRNAYVHRPNRIRVEWDLSDAFDSIHSSMFESNRRPHDAKVYWSYSNWMRRICHKMSHPSLPLSSPAPSQSIRHIRRFRPSSNPSPRSNGRRYADLYPLTRITTIAIDPKRLGTVVDQWRLNSVPWGHPRRRTTV